MPYQTIQSPLIDFAVLLREQLRSNGRTIYEIGYQHPNEYFLTGVCNGRVCYVLLPAPLGARMYSNWRRHLGGLGAQTTADVVALAVRLARCPVFSRVVYPGNGRPA